MTDTTATIESHQHARAIFERLNGNYSSEVVLAALRLAYSSGAAAEAARHLAETRNDDGDYSLDAQRDRLAALDTAEDKL